MAQECLSQVKDLGLNCDSYCNFLPNYISCQETHFIYGFSTRYTGADFKMHEMYNVHEVYRCGLNGHGFCGPFMNLS